MVVRKSLTTLADQFLSAVPDAAWRIEQLVDTVTPVDPTDVSPILDTGLALNLEMHFAEQPAIVIVLGPIGWSKSRWRSRRSSFLILVRPPSFKILRD
jgi:hypothetical protein